MANTYHLKEAPADVHPYDGKSVPVPDRLFWSGPFPIPKIGDRVHVYMNGFGPGAVEGYFIEHSFLGVHVRPDHRPNWHVKQEPGRQVICAFGIDLLMRFWGS